MTARTALLRFLVAPAASLSLLALLLGRRWIAAWLAVSALGWLGVAWWIGKERP